MGMRDSQGFLLVGHVAFKLEQLYAIAQPECSENGLCVSSGTVTIYSHILHSSDILSKILK